MWRSFREGVAWLRVRTYQRRIASALSLSARSAARKDGLRLQKLTNRLFIRWRARDIHPWDRGCPPQERARLFVAQCLGDTEAAISALFRKLPQVDVLELEVMAPVSDAILLAGTVSRRSLSEESQHYSSIKMRLNALGLRYRIRGACFEPLAPEREIAAGGESRLRSDRTSGRDEDVA